MNLRDHRADRKASKMDVTTLDTHHLRGVLIGHLGLVGGYPVSTSAMILFVRQHGGFSRLTDEEIIETIVTAAVLRGFPVEFDSRAIATCRR